MCWTPGRLIWLACGVLACWWLAPDWLPLLAGVGAFEMGCGCGCANLSPCEDCCNDVPSFTIKITIPAGVFTDGEFCNVCADLDDIEVFVDNFPILNDCDWLTTDTTNICGGSSTSISYGFSLRKDTPSAGTCEVRFRYGITCDGFATTYDWSATFSDPGDCSSLSLAYEGASDDTLCCTVDAAPGNVTVEMNP